MGKLDFCPQDSPPLGVYNLPWNGLFLIKWGPPTWGSKMDQGVLSRCGWDPLTSFTRLPWGYLRHFGGSILYHWIWTPPHRFKSIGMVWAWVRGSFHHISYTNRMHLNLWDGVNECTPFKPQPVFTRLVPKVYLIRTLSSWTLMRDRWENWGKPA